MKETHGSQREGAPDRHMEAAPSELALAKVLGIEWNGQGDFGPDVGLNIEARWTLPGNRLLVHRDERNGQPPDNDDHAYFLVFGALRKYEIIGWVWGREGKQHPEFSEYPGKYLDRPCCYVHAHKLHRTVTIEGNEVIGL